MKGLHLLLQRFADAGLEFVVVGGFAGVLHGSSYVTDDLDICAVLTGENAKSCEPRWQICTRSTGSRPTNYLFWNTRRPGRRWRIFIGKPLPGWSM